MNNGERFKENILGFKQLRTSPLGLRRASDENDYQLGDDTFSTATANSSIVKTMRALLLFMVKTIVDFDNLVEVDVVAYQDNTTFVIRVDPVDVGKLIGKNGRTARSIRTILTAASRKYNARFLLDINVEE